MYIQIFDTNGASIGAEHLPDPIFVRWQPGSGRLVRCKKKESEGIVGLDGNTIYVNGGTMPHGIPEPYFVEITQEEYEQIKRKEPDEEDANPDIPPDVEKPPMTRVELTEKIAELESTNAMLMECLMEMSEIVYA